jgi:hypothetical protein
MPREAGRAPGPLAPIWAALFSPWTYVGHPPAPRKPGSLSRRPLLWWYGLLREKGVGPGPVPPQVFSRNAGDSDSDFGA